MIRLDHSRGYRYIRVDEPEVPEEDAPVYVAVHRLVALSEGLLDGLREEQDSREVHHVDGVRSRNSESNLDGLSPGEHGSTTRAAQDAREAPHVVGVEWGMCGSCSEGRPHERHESGSRRCVVCSTVSEVDEERIETQPSVEDGSSGRRSA